MKRFAALFLSAAMVASILTGCSGNTGTSGSAATAAPAATEQKTETTAETTSEEAEATTEKKPMTFTVFSKDVNSQYEDFQSPVAKKITELTGVTLKMEYPVGDLKEKTGLMLASGEYPDMMFLSGEIGPFVEAGAVIDLTDRIMNSKYIIKMVDGYTNRLKYSMDDQAIYTLPGFGSFDQRWEPAMGFWLTHKAVKASEYPQIKTLEDAEKIISDYVAANPTVDGQPTIGLSFATDDWRWQCAVGNMAASVTGLPDDGNWYIDPKTYDATFRFALDNHKQYYKWLNHMNDIQLLDPEAFTQKYDQYTAKIASGRVVGLTDQAWEIQEGLNALKSAKNYESMFGVYPVQLDDTYTSGDFIDKGFTAGWGMSISDRCKDPDAAFAFLDWMASDEAQILNNWGIEGEHYTIENGKRVIPDDEWNRRLTDPEYGKKTGIGVYLYPFPAWGKGVLDPSGQSYSTTTIDTIVNNYNEVEKDVLSKYGVTMWKDLYPQADQLNRVDPWGYAWQMTIPDTSEVPVIVTKMLDLTKKYIAASVLAKPDQFDAVWDEFQGELKKAGLDEATQEYSKLMKQRVELWK